ncbi:MAG: RnfABCDGE type electron transport complex subunit G [Eubacterium sp.]|nr:RnfABCDGE type electron transport complex subunit G [Eubacterium sp.]
MEKKKDTMVKDAIILCLITLVLGAVLAGVYAITKKPIEEAQAKTNNEACEKVVADGDKVLDNDENKVGDATEYLNSHDLSNAEVAEVSDSLSGWVVIEEAHPTENGGTVYLVTAKKGYGGDLSFALGVGADSAITGISITSQAETAGLGANCENEEWQAGFAGKVLPSDPSQVMYNKQESNDSQVQALSGATVTSRAIANAVKGVLFADAAGKEAA